MNFWRSITNRLLRESHKSASVRNLFPLLNQAHDLLKSEEYAKARHILLNAAQFREHIPDAATVDWILGALEATWLLQDQFEEQIAFFSNYVDRYPHDSAGHRGRASALWYTDQLNDSMDAYSRAIALAPTDILSRSGRGQILAELGDGERAMEDLDVALRILDSMSKTTDDTREWCKHVEAFVRRGRAVAFAGSGQVAAAMNEFDKSMSLSPENAWVYYSRARIFDQQGDGIRALSDYAAAMTKTQPGLRPGQKERAHARIDDLSRGPKS